MSPFHSGMNHWQRQWLSDRLHKKRPVESEPVRTFSQPVQPPRPSSPKPEPSKASIIPKRKPPPPRLAKIIWPSAEVLGKLIWEKPTSQIAKELGVSDKAIEKHCKKLALKKPPRGYWAKIQAGESERP
jgi:hypothetical protein